MICIFYCFFVCVKGFKLWCLETNKIIISGDVTFGEIVMFHPRKKPFVLNDKTKQNVLDKVEQKPKRDGDVATSQTTMPRRHNKQS